MSDERQPVPEKRSADAVADLLYNLHVKLNTVGVELNEVFITLDDLSNTTDDMNIIEVYARVSNHLTEARAQLEAARHAAPRSLRLDQSRAEVDAQIAAEVNDNGYTDLDDPTWHALGRCPDCDNSFILAQVTTWATYLDQRPFKYDWTELQYVRPNEDEEVYCRTCYCSWVPGNEEEVAKKLAAITTGAVPPVPNPAFDAKSRAELLHARFAARVKMVKEE
jgi:hypothetical protein